MSIKPQQLRQLIWDVLAGYEPVIPATRGAVELLVLTAAAESNCGEYLQQEPSHIAQGIFQMEPDTHLWLRQQLLPARFPDLVPYLDSWCAADSPRLALSLTGNICYQIAIARAYYWVKTFTMPEVSDKPAVLKIRELAMIWKKYWNTFKGKGTVEGAVQKWMIYG